VPHDVSWQDAVTSVFVTIPDLATPEQVQSSLREILGDPALEIFWWDWEAECYVNVLGQPAEVPERPDRVLTPVEYATRRVGLIAHDPQLLEEPEFLGSLVPMLRIAMERDRLHRDLVEKLDLLRSSRQRIVQAADEERRRLERNLHDGAQQRLVATRLLLVALERRAAGDPELAALATQAREELDGALGDLRELARGLHPPLLTEQGLEAAIRAGSERSSLVIDLDLDIGAGLSPAVEAAAYYVCSEAITNAVKHASAKRAWLSVAHRNGWLTVEVRDDGCGGAHFATGEATGLIGLKDRVEALEGTFEVLSPPGAGTAIVAAFPVG
jgi:signal transduction histidine kinase